MYARGPASLWKASNDNKPGLLPSPLLSSSLCPEGIDGDIPQCQSTSAPAGSWEEVG